MTELKGKILAGRVLIKPQEVKEKTESGIIIPEVAKEKLSQGEVVLTGCDKQDQPMEVVVGDKVFYGKYCGEKVVIEETEYLLMSQMEILYVEG